MGLFFEKMKNRFVDFLNNAVLSPLKESKSAVFHACAYGISGVLLLLGFSQELFNVILLGILVLWFSNLVYGFQKWRSRLIFLVFHFTLFTFLIARPLISMFRGFAWWYFQRETVYFALTVLWLTLVSLRLGCAVYEYTAPGFQGKNCRILEDRTGYDVYNETSYTKCLRFVSLAFFGLTSVFYWMIQIEKLMFMQGNDYAEIYISYTSALPWFVFTLSDMTVYALAVSLATFPKKRICYCVLIVYVIGTVPSLIIGARNPIVLALIFSFVYFLLRDILEKRSYWVGKFEKTAMVVAVPGALVFLAFYNYMREGQAVSMGIGQSIVDLFYKQGVSFDVLCKAYDAIPYLPDAVAKNYTFGPMIDYITRGSVGQMLFGMESLGTLNSEKLAIYGNSFAHSMSYIAHPGYLKGHGYGSSYVLELFADWGYIGVALGSAVLGFFMGAMIDLLRKGPLVRTVVILGLTTLFFIPRAEATKWISFVVMMQFWLVIGFCFVGAYLLSKRKPIAAWLAQKFAGN